jgi:hypothetical protein
MGSRAHLRPHHQARRARGQLFADVADNAHTDKAEHQPGPHWSGEPIGHGPLSWAFNAGVKPSEG